MNCYTCGKKMSHGSIGCSVGDMRHTGDIMCFDCEKLTKSPIETLKQFKALEKRVYDLELSRATNALSFVTERQSKENNIQSAFFGFAEKYKAIKNSLYNREIKEADIFSLIDKNIKELGVTILEVYYAGFGQKSGKNGAQQKRNSRRKKAGRKNAGSRK